MNYVHIYTIYIITYITFGLAPSLTRTKTSIDLHFYRERERERESESVKEIEREKKTMLCKLQYSFMDPNYGILLGIQITVFC